LPPLAFFCLFAGKHYTWTHDSGFQFCYELFCSFIQTTFSTLSSCESDEGIYYQGVMVWIWNVPHKFTCWTLGLQLMALFWKAVRNEAQLEEAGPWGCAWWVISGPSSLFCLCFLLVVRWTACGPRIKGPWIEISATMSHNKSLLWHIFCHNDKKSDEHIRDTGKTKWVFRDTGKTK
jgi:hypothetical protein